MNDSRCIRICCFHIGMWKIKGVSVDKYPIAAYNKQNNKGGYPYGTKE